MEKKEESFLHFGKNDLRHRDFLSKEARTAENIIDVKEITLQENEPKTGLSL